MKIKIFLLSLALVVVSCGNRNTTDNTKSVVEVNFGDTSTNNNDNKIYTRYQIPLPVDLFEVLSEKGEFNKNILLPVSYGNNYESEVQKAIALGLYNADLAYCSVFGQGQASIDYFNVSKNIAQELNIEKGYSDELFEKMNKYMDNVDSLVDYVNTVYRNTCNYMEERQMKNVLPFVVASGWYESLYIILKSKSPNLNEREIRKIVLEQEKGFKHVKKFLYDEQIESSAFYYHKYLKQIIAGIDSILRLYKKYEISPADRDAVYRQLVKEIIRQRERFVRGEI